MARSENGQGCLKGSLPVSADQLSEGLFVSLFGKEHKSGVRSYGFSLSARKW
jgi:hypothetical protein